MDHPEAIPRFPLSWPMSWRRTLAAKRRAGQFSETFEVAREGMVKKRTKAVSMATAVERLEMQLDKLGARDPVLSTNIKLNLRGIPYGNESPSDPGAAVYFGFKGKATVLACDTYVAVSDNIAALAAHIDALRRIDRYGVGSLEQALAGYKALPADTAADWRKVLGFSAEARVSAEDVNARYKELSKVTHPDSANGNHEMFIYLGRAKEFALSEILE